MLAENPVPSARVGPTLAYLLVDQFLRFKKGDRFWYENDVYFHHFTKGMYVQWKYSSAILFVCSENYNTHVSTF